VFPIPHIGGYLNWGTIGRAAIVGARQTLDANRRHIADLLDVIINAERD
jgi:hypothetical protein